MPCNDWSASDTINEYAADARELRAMLCEACSAWGGEMPPSMRIWWEVHQRQDRERVKNLEREREQSIARLKRQRSQIDDELATLAKR